MPKFAPTDAIAYQRFSPRRKEKGGCKIEIPPAEKLDLQHEANRAYCQWAGLNLRWRIDEPYTSAYELDLAERPMGPEIVRLFDGGCKHIVTTKVDRLFRSMRDGLSWIEEFNRRGITWHIADQRGVTMRTNTADGFMCVVWNLAMPQIEAMRTRERTSTDMRRRQSRGDKMGGNAPYGWRIEGDDLIPVPDEQDTLQELLSLAETMPAAAVAARLNAQGKLARNGTLWRTIKIIRNIERHRKETHV